MDAHGEKQYNRGIRIAPAQLRTAGSVSHDGVSVMTTPIVVSPCDSDNLKRCSKCGELKPRQAFALNKRRHDGLQVYCKACNAAYRRDRKPEKAAYNKSYYEAHADDLREYGRNYHHEHRDERRAYRSEYYAKNRDRLLTRQAIYNSSPEFKARRSAYDRQHRQSNKLKYSIRDANRRARERKLGSYITLADIELIRKSQTDTKGRLICWRCGKPITHNPHLDHFIPLDKGGSHSPGNLHFMHAKCNLSKATKHPHELGMLI